MARFAIARFDEIDEITDGRCPWRPVRHHFGITSFGAGAWTGHAAGDRIINEHDEEGEHEELYVVLSGRARFELGDETRDAPAGTYVFVEPGLRRTAWAEEPETTILAIGGQPGEAYRASGYEIWAQLREAHAAGDYADVAARGKKLVAENPQYAYPLYNVACCEALVGDTDDALEHLRQALALDERFRDYAKGDSDFDSVRDDPRFAEIVGG